MFLETQTPGKTADPFSLESLIAWLEKKPANEPYNASSLRNCMLGQWLHDEHGLRDCEQRNRCYDMGETEPFKTIAAIATSEETTFGAALARARKALAT